MSPRSRGLVAALVVAAPVLVGVVYSMLAALGVVGVGGGGRASAGAALRVLREPAVWESLAWSIWVAGASTGLATAGAVAVASLFRGRGRFHRLARLLALAPLPIPHLVAGVMGVLILGQSGLLGRLAHAAGLISVPAQMPALVYDPYGIGLIAALTWKELPFLALAAFSVLAQAGEGLEETARSLGAPPREVFRRVTLPVLWRGILPAVVAVFTFAAGSYEVAGLLAPSDPLAFPLLIMERYQGSALAERADAFVLSLLALGLAGLAVAVHERVRGRWPELQG